MDTDKYKLSVNKFRLELNGNSCEDCRSVCQAMCCKFPWPIAISLEEYNSGQYDAIMNCALSNTACKRDKDECQYRTYQLNKNPDNSCLYLDKNNFCSIYNVRPEVCRQFQCSFSFNLTPTSISNTFQANKNNDQSSHIIKDDQIIIPHPLIKLQGIILHKRLKSLYFILEIIAGCGVFYSADEIDIPRIEEEHILDLIGLFEERVPMETVRLNFFEKYGDVLSDQSFYKLVNILLKHNLLINIKNLRGLLSGLGL